MIWIIGKSDLFIGYLSKVSKSLVLFPGYNKYFSGAYKDTHVSKKLNKGGGGRNYWLFLCLIYLFDIDLSPDSTIE